MRADPDLPRLLESVMTAVLEAGGMLRREALRPDGPRGSGSHADVDSEIEQHLRASLTDLLPALFVGEETGTSGTAAGGFCWLVDPHDGTADFLRGHRGSAVSVALLRDREPVLGVVHAPMPPDRGSDLIAWAEGIDHLLRNGRPVRNDLSAAALTPGAIVFLNEDARLYPLGNGAFVKPARFVALTSIAYRLARVAAGDGEAAVSLNGPEGHDYAGGHALLIGAGGVLLDEQGDPVRYSTGGSSRCGACYGGGPAAAKALAARKRAGEAKRPPPVTLGWPRRDDDQADRAIGCLFGQVIGDALGSLVEFRSPQEIAAVYPDGVRNLIDGGAWDTIAGQPTDDSELALALARSIVAEHGYEEEAAATAYARWYSSGPFDIGGTTARALSAAAAPPQGRLKPPAPPPARRARPTVRS